MQKTHNLVGDFSLEIEPTKQENVFVQVCCEHKMTEVHTTSMATSTTRAQRHTGSKTLLCKLVFTCKI